MMMSTFGESEPSCHGLNQVCNSVWFMIFKCCCGCLVAVHPSMVASGRLIECCHSGQCLHLEVTINVDPVVFGCQDNRVVVHQSNIKTLCVFHFTL